jgi:hypothetical protein
MFRLARQHLSRRAMLRGVGTCLALPLLDAMVPRTSTANVPPRGQADSRRRMLCCYVPNGVNEREWTPDGTGPDWKPSPTLKLLDKHRGHVTILSGLGHPKSQGGHYGADTWLTAADLLGTPGRDYQNSVSVDQLAAEVQGPHTRFPSLELSNGGGTGGANHSHTLAFDRGGTPLPTENSPGRLFERLFTPEGAASREATVRRHAEQRSILDEILNDANSMSRQLSAADRRKLDEYLSSVRQTEVRVQRMQNWIDAPKPNVSRDGLRLGASPEGPHDRSMWLDSMLDLCCLALQTDTTRVITFEWAREASGFGPNGEDHHELSHHGGDSEMLQQLAGIDRFYLAKLVRLLDRMKSIEESESTLLDQTMILYGSGMSSGQGGGHSPKNLPLLLAGGRGIGFRHGKHVRLESDRVPLSNLLLTMLQQMGVERDSFADSTGTLTGIT